jgi:CRISPR/Cas system-associated exonuclease Cas4 (RecB family)
MYSLFFEKAKGEGELPLVPSLLYLRDIYQEGFSMEVIENPAPRQNIPVSDFSPYREATRQNLTQLLELLFGTETTFSQTENLDYCKNCAFREICQR